MKDELISIETAKLAKEKGFKESVKTSYYETIQHTIDMGRGGDCTFPYQAPRILEGYSKDEHTTLIALAPTQSLLQKWLRKKHDINVYCVCRVGRWEYWIDKISPLSQEPTTYEKALEKGLLEALKFIGQNL